MSPTADPPHWLYRDEVRELMRLRATAARCSTALGAFAGPLGLCVAQVVLHTGERGFFHSPRSGGIAAIAAVCLFVGVLLALGLRMANEQRRALVARIRGRRVGVTRAPEPGPTSAMTPGDVAEFERLRQANVRCAWAIGLCLGPVVGMGLTFFESDPSAPYYAAVMILGGLCVAPLLLAGSTALDVRHRRRALFARLRAQRMP